MQSMPAGVHRGLRLLAEPDEDEIRVARVRGPRIAVRVELPVDPAPVGQGLLRRRVPEERGHRVLLARLDDVDGEDAVALDERWRGILCEAELLPRGIAARALFPEELRAGLGLEVCAYLFGRIARLARLSA